MTSVPTGLCSLLRAPGRAPGFLGDGMILLILGVGPDTIRSAGLWRPLALPYRNRVASPFTQTAEELQPSAFDPSHFVGSSP